MPWWKHWSESCSEDSGRLGPKSEPSEIMTLSLPEKIEVKLAFVSDDTAKAFALLGLNDPPKEERRIHFFDSGKLALFDRGLILRVRQTVVGDDAEDATLKVRGPTAADAASRFLAAAGAAAKFEGDQNVGREELPSFSINHRARFRSRGCRRYRPAKGGIRPERSQPDAVPRNRRRRS